ncbi:hypothetical protein RCL1_003201 [Eukaryota sp. TZLM3-RCL]
MFDDLGNKFESQDAKTILSELISMYQTVGDHDCLAEPPDDVIRVLRDFLNDEMRLMFSKGMFLEEFVEKQCFVIISTLAAAQISVKTKATFE